MADASSGSNHPKLRKTGVLISGLVLSAGLLTVVAFFLRFYGNGWNVGGSSFTNWIVLVVFSICAWIPAKILQKLTLGIIKFLYQVYHYNRLQHGRTKVLFKAMSGATTFFIWSILEFLVVSFTFQWNPFPLDNGQGDIHENGTLGIINIILVVAAALSVVKQYFIVTKVKLAKRTDYVESKAQEALNWERALNIIAADLNPAAFRKKRVEHLKYEDISLSRRSAIDAGNETRFNVAQLFPGMPLRKRGHTNHRARDATHVQVDTHTTRTNGGDAKDSNLGVPVVRRVSVDEPSDDDPARMLSSEPAADSLVVPEDADVDAPDGDTDIYHELEHLRRHYVTCCNGQIVLRTKADSRKLAGLLIVLLTEAQQRETTMHTQNGDNTDEPKGADIGVDVTQSDLPHLRQSLSALHTPPDEVPCVSNAGGTPPGEEETDGESHGLVDNDNRHACISVDFLLRHVKHDKDVASLVTDVLGCVSEISRGRLKSGIEVVRKQRKNLRQSLEDLDSTVKAVDAFLMVFIAIALMLLLLVVFSQGDFAQVAVTSSTSVFALSFIFAETAKNFFNSFVFLFLRHPFDVGDRIHIGAASNEPYFVLKMELLTTTFKMWSGHIVTIPNHILYQSTIFNVARAGPMTDSVEVLVKRQTTPQQIKLLDAEFSSFIRDHPDDYLGTSKMYVRDYRDWNSILVVFFLDYTTNWQLSQHLHRKQNAIFCVQAACAKYGVSAQQTQLPVELTMSRDQTSTMFDAMQSRSASPLIRSTEATV
eukprot:m.312595 g.312595  ORF g.312595 m.312595 type:complete len:763 (-) comp20242_c0_seq2:203-2491(-)